MNQAYSTVVTIITILFLSFFTFFNLFGQITFEKAYGDTGTTGGSTVQQTTDGGYILFGVLAEGEDFKYSWYLIKTNSLGNKQWEKKFGDEYQLEYQNSMQQTSDGGYILCGSFGGPFNDSLVLIKTDSLGNQDWMKSYPVADGESVGRFVQQTMDGGFIVVGHAGEIMHEDIYVIKTNPDGVLEWSKTYGGDEGDYGYCIRQTQEGDYILLGVTNSFGNGKHDMYVLKLNENGDTLWTKTFGTKADEGGYSLDLTSDGGFICSGLAGDLSKDFYVVKADVDGNEKWHKHYGMEWWDFCHSVFQTNDDGYFLAGIYTLGPELSSEMHCIKTDPAGDILWERGFRLGEVNEAYSAQQTSDGGYVILGTTVFLTDTVNTSHMYLVKVDANGIITNVTIPGYEPACRVGPNPFTEYIRFNFDSPIEREYVLLLFDAQGKEILNQSGLVDDEIILKEKIYHQGLISTGLVQMARSLG